ncbi:Thermostable 8-oxoguanine DNA glycosylase [Variovorax sp. YR750]|uniref:8-oxoguanine DNA glycosylase n=1 Tax=Variovorax sp. YR750 TaxID=1884384 RepID=UPI0008B05B11|nr:8-oxoguanine DNA glycosylase [Variovorax sp. YR750]SEM10558.1 Thermostable 8-oxoguanine DNA glycosylase [Variovorax sp. YR750]
MTQHAAIFLGHTAVHLELPSAANEVVAGVPWGAIDAFPTPAYWAFQVMARRVNGTSVRYRIGNTLAEEVAACLLGGHGISASIGLAAFRHLKQHGLLSLERGAPTEADLLAKLSTPMELEGRSVLYRFAKQKARYLNAAFNRLVQEPAPTGTGRQLRDWLLPVQGIGPKTASWIARNWLDADDVAILDIHILRAGMLGGFFDQGLTVERDYLKLEQQFLAFARGLGVRASELDALMWLEMASSQTTVHELLRERLPAPAAKQQTRNQRQIKSRAPAHQRRADTRQARLVD